MRNLASRMDLPMVILSWVCVALWGVVAIRDLAPGGWPPSSVICLGFLASATIQTIYKLRAKRSSAMPRYLDGVLVDDDGPQWVRVNGIRYERSERR